MRHPRRKSPDWLRLYSRLARRGPRNSSKFTPANLNATPFGFSRRRSSRPNCAAPFTQSTRGPSSAHSKP
jgi:hypothetical protein